VVRSPEPALSPRIASTPNGFTSPSRMTTQIFATPEAAAMQGFPAGHCRVVAVSVDGDDGFVVRDTGQP